MISLKKHVAAMALLLPCYAVGSSPYYSLTLEWPSPQTTPYQFYGNGKQQAPFMAIMCVPLGYKVQWEKVSFYDKKTRAPYGTEFSRDIHVKIEDVANEFMRGIFPASRVENDNVAIKDEKQGAHSSYGNCTKSIADTATRKLYLMSDSYENDLSVCASYKDESLKDPLELDSCNTDFLSAKTITPFKYINDDYMQSNISQDRHPASTFIEIKTVLKFSPKRSLPNIKHYPMIDESFNSGGIGGWNQCLRAIGTIDFDKGIYEMDAFFPSSFSLSECDEAFTPETPFEFTDEYGNAGATSVVLCFDHPTSC